MLLMISAEYKNQTIPIYNPKMQYSCCTDKFPLLKTPNVLLFNRIDLFSLQQ